MEIGKRRRQQAPPPYVVFEGLTQPHRQPSRRWLILNDDEQEPTILEQDPPRRLVWSSLWPSHPTARITIELDRDPSGSGCDLCWTLDVDVPGPSPSAIGHLRKRLNTLINGNLRDYFDN